MKKPDKETKIKILRILTALGVFIAIAVIVAVILACFGVIRFDKGIKINAELFDRLKNSAGGIASYILIQVVVTSLLCVLPGTSMAFIALSAAIFDTPTHAFLISFSAVLLSSAAMYLLGRFGGYKICELLIGKEDCEKSAKLLRDKGTVYFPLMMAFPLFPDDGLVMLAGVTKMSLAWFFPSVIFGRGIGIATIVYGLSIVPFEKFTSLYDYIVLITICAFWAIILFYLAHKLNLYLEKRRNKDNENGQG